MLREVVLVCIDYMRRRRSCSLRNRARHGKRLHIPYRFHGPSRQLCNRFNCVLYMYVYTTGPITMLSNHSIWYLIYVYIYIERERERETERETDIYVYIYAYTYIDIYVCIYAYTYIHIYTQIYMKHPTQGQSAGIFL